MFLLFLVCFPTFISSTHVLLVFPPLCESVFFPHSSGFTAVAACVVYRPDLYFYCLVFVCVVSDSTWLLRYNCC